MFHDTGASVSRRCEEILRGLPEWFGIEQAIQDYERFIRAAPTFTIAHGVEQVAGFISLKRHSPTSAEVYVMAVDARHHGVGLGTMLLTEVERWCASEGVHFLQVKTLDASASSAPYAATRRFYEAQGFTLLEVFPELWDPWNPCALYIKYLDCQRVSSRSSVSR